MRRPCSFSGFTAAISIQTERVRLRRMQVKGELRGHLGWNGDIIQPWGHNHRAAIAVKRLGSHAVHGFVILVTRDTGRAEGDHHLGRTDTMTRHTSWVSVSKSAVLSS